MFIDLHIHEAHFSFDSNMRIEDIVARAKAVGLDGVCITDHEHMGFRDLADKYSKELDFPIFVGAEYLTKEGDILAFGIDNLPHENKLSAQDFIDHVRGQGGATIAAHPFRNNNRGLEENLLKVEGLTAIEVLNGSTSKAANQIAMDYCKTLGLSPTGASDAHVPNQVGKYATWFPQGVKTIEDIVEALKARETRPAILRGYKTIDL